MMDNQKSKIVNVLSDYRHRSRVKRWAWNRLPWPTRLAAKAVAAREFYIKVRSRGEWDHKGPLSRMLRLGATNDFYFPIRGFPNSEVYFDIWSNIHYGFVGRAAAIHPRILHEAARRFSLHDEGDKISIQTGIQLWHGYGEDLKIHHLQRGILLAKPLYERAERRDPTLDLLIPPRGCHC